MMSGNAEADQQKVVDIPRKLQGQVAVVTGGGRGIGRVIAQYLAAAGAGVAVLARSQDQLDQTAAEIEAAGGRVAAWTADVTDGGRISEVIAGVERTLGSITLLVNNAGTSSASGPVWVGDPDEWWRNVEINLRGPYLCTRTVLPGMLSRGVGRIVNVGSNLGIRPAPNLTAYGCSKAALLRLTDSLAEEVKDHGLQAFAISPGWVWTAMTRRAIQEMEAANPDFEGIPESFIFPPEDCANLVLRLAAGEADQLTGRYIHVSDDLDQLIAQAAEIQAQDLYALRLRS